MEREREEEFVGGRSRWLRRSKQTAALEAAVGKLRRRGKRVEVVGLNAASALLVDRHGPAIQAAMGAGAG